MTYIERLQDIVRTLRSEHGCPWDRKQTHESIKPGCIEEAVEVLCGINILRETGKADNLREELGDLLLQVIFHAQLAEEAGLFSVRRAEARLFPLTEGRLGDSLMPSASIQA